VRDRCVLSAPPSPRLWSSPNWVARRAASPRRPCSSYRWCSSASPGASTSRPSSPPKPSRVEREPRRVYGHQRHGPPHRADGRSPPHGLPRRLPRGHRRLPRHRDHRPRRVSPRFRRGASEARPGHRSDRGQPDGAVLRDAEGVIHNMLWIKHDKSWITASGVTRD